MDNEYFSNMADIEDLSLDKVFLVYESEPILFLCKDKNDNMYFCVCTEIRYIKKWLVTKISSDDLSDLENQKIDIYTAITKNEKMIEIIQIEDRMISFNRYTKFIDDRYLPEKGTFLKINMEDN